jgi:glycosyltransferase involved in cell wall biosynthesis
MESQAGTELTVIIPTYNRSSVLMKCLDALRRQTLPGNAFEIIVSDDGSDDDTRIVTEGFARDGSHDVQYLWQPNRGQSAAKNQAILRAKGRLLLFINDDTIATPGMLEQHVRSHEAYPKEHFAVLGRITISPEFACSLFSKLHLDASYRLWEG